MNIVAVTACTAGIAHTYIVAEKLQKAAVELGHNCKVETQGSAGIHTPGQRIEMEISCTSLVTGSSKKKRVCYGSGTTQS